MDTKTALLDSAEKAVRARGYDGFSYADLAAEVGIRKASIHYHFPAKADLARELIDRYTQRFFDILAQIDAREDTAAARMAAYIDVIRGVADDGNQLCLCVSYCMGRESLDSEVLERLNAYHMSHAKWLEDVFGIAKSDGSISGVENPAREAIACLAQVEGAQLIARAAKDGAMFDDAVASLKARLKSG